MHGVCTSRVSHVCHAAHADLPLRRGAPGPQPERLIREAIDTFLQQQPQGRLARLRQARGLWAERSDLPDWSALRSALDRLPAGLMP